MLEKSANGRLRLETTASKAWNGDFGASYHDRNQRAALRARTRLWGRILGDIDPESILEVGAGTGTNLIALHSLTGARLMAVEPNEGARKQIPYGVVELVGPSRADHLSFMDGAAELVFTSGVLIHIPPDELDAALDEIYRVSSRYIACIEYFSDTPETKSYRGRDNLLFKRDFGAYWLERFPDLEVVRTGFAWRTTTGLDNLTWHLFSKGR